MPGKHLNQDESKLFNLWQNPPQNIPRPYLRSITISGGTGLRGIDGLIIPFRYPITAICGSNGVGKSTILALAALAYHSPSGWFVYWGNSRPRPANNDLSYYIFSDFFVAGHGELPPSDVSITWRYFQNNSEFSVTFKKTSTGWGKYSRRPEREVGFLPLGRLLPAQEISGVRSTFLKPADQIQSAFLNDKFRKSLSYIMGRQYSQAEVQKSRRYTFQRCKAQAQYTAFNMGCGESCIIGLLNLLEQIPNAGLVVIEEIEAGLHPQAQVRLIKALIQICLSKKIQVICSTHSETFLDALPRQARLLLRKSSNEHSVIEFPSTRFAVYEMTGIAQPELVIYCEDIVATTLIEEALPYNMRQRVKILEVGSNVTVIRQGVSHLRSGFQMQALCILDGDCRPADIERWIESEQGGQNNSRPEYLILPGNGVSPEIWAVSQIAHQTYLGEFAKQLDCTVIEAQAHVNALQVETDPHNIGFTLYQRTNINQSACTRCIMRSFALVHPQLEELRNKVSSFLNL